MEKHYECMCCKEIQGVKDKIEELRELDNETNSVGCITDHIGFDQVCLAKHNLQALYLNYKCQYGHQMVSQHK